MSTPLVADHAAQYRCYQACLGILLPAIGLSTLLRHVLCVAKNWTVFDELYCMPNFLNYWNKSEQD